MTAAILAALMIVETGGDPAAWCAKERAAGILQIRPCVIADVNERYGTRYAHADAFDPDKAAAICWLYLVRWCGTDASPEVYARTWNGGPRGRSKASTLTYWHRFERAIEKGGSNHGA
jgi:hypothetical protein